MIRTGNEKLDSRTLLLPVASGARITEATMVAIGRTAMQCQLRRLPV